MMNKIALLGFAWTILCIMGAASSPYQVPIQKLSKKWTLSKYSVFFYSYPPEENELNDYMSLNSDMTYTSISEGRFGEGNWQYDASSNSISLTDDREEGELVLVIEKLTETSLVVHIEDPNDADTKYLKIHFNTDK